MSLGAGSSVARADEKRPLKIVEDSGKFRLVYESTNGNLNIPTESMQKFIGLAQLKRYEQVGSALAKVTGNGNPVEAYRGVADFLMRGASDRAAVETLKKEFEEFSTNPEKYLTKKHISQVELNEHLRTQEQCLAVLKGKLSPDQSARVQTFFEALSIIASDENCHVLSMRNKETGGVAGPAIKYASDSDCATFIASNTTGAGSGEIEIKFFGEKRSTARVNEIESRTIRYNAVSKDPLTKGQWLVQLYSEMGRVGLCGPAKKIPSVFSIGAPSHPVETGR